MFAISVCKKCVEMAVALQSRSRSAPKVKKVFDDLFSEDIMSYSVYKCKQIFYSSDSTCKDYFQCPAEFTSEKYNLNTCFIYPNINVAYEKCVNIKVASAISLTTVRRSPDEYQESDSVCCELCDTVIGVVYNGSIGLSFKVKANADARSAIDAPMTEPMDRRQRQRGFLDGAINMRLLPPSLPQAEVVAMQYAMRNIASELSNEAIALPILERYRSGDRPDLKKLEADFVFVSCFISFFVFVFRLLQFSQCF